MVQINSPSLHQMQQYQPPIPAGGLPPEQTALRDKSRLPDSQWVDFTPEDVNQTIPQLLARMIERYPERLASKDPLRSYTFTELDRGANQVAQAVLQAGGAGNEPVPYIFFMDSRRSPAAHGILRAGKPVIPIDAADAPDRLAYLISDAGARVVVTCDEMVATVASLAPAGCRVINLDEVLAGNVADSVLEPSAPTDIAALLYTSGSTGQPKGVINSHRAMLARLRGHIIYDLCGPGERFTSIGLRMGEISYPLAGATNCPFPIRQQGLPAFARWLADEKITRHERRGKRLSPTA